MYIRLNTLHYFSMLRIVYFDTKVKMNVEQIRKGFIFTM